MPTTSRAETERFLQDRRRTLAAPFLIDEEARKRRSRARSRTNQLERRIGIRSVSVRTIQSSTARTSISTRMEDEEEEEETTLLQIARWAVTLPLPDEIEIEARVLSEEDHPATLSGSIFVLVTPTAPSLPSDASKPQPSSFNPPPDFTTTSLPSHLQPSPPSFPNPSPFVDSCSASLVLLDSPRPELSVPSPRRIRSRLGPTRLCFLRGCRAARVRIRDSRLPCRTRKGGGGCCSWEGRERERRSGREGTLGRWRGRGRAKRRLDLRGRTAEQWRK